MSFLFVLPKKNGTHSVHLQMLKKNLCPYNKEVKIRDLGKGRLYYNDFSSLDQNSFLSPAGHKFEKCSAWAAIQFSENKIKIETDPLGQCPIWYTQNEEFVAISPEQKAFKALSGFQFALKDEEYFLNVFQRGSVEQDFQNISRLPPGTVLVVDMDKKEMHTKDQALLWNQYSRQAEMRLEEAQDLLKAALLTSASEIPSMTVSLLSGGIDSSVACAIVKGIQCSYNLKTDLGDEEKESQQTARFLGVGNKTIFLNQDEILSDYESVVRANELTDGLTAEILLQLLAILRHLPADQKGVVTGYGADLLFGGMLGHKAYLSITGTRDTNSLIERTYWSKEFSPFYYWSQGKRHFNLYWHPEVLKAGLQIPLGLQQQVLGTEKFVLRSLAVKEGWLSRDLAFRKKTGMTNGTQINVLLSRVLSLKDEYSYFEKTKNTFKKFTADFQADL